MRLSYRKADSSGPSNRIICPYGIVFASGNWYAVAHRESAVRHVLQYGLDATVLEPAEVREAACGGWRTWAAPEPGPPGAQPALTERAPLPYRYDSHHARLRPLSSAYRRHRGYSATTTAIHTT